MTDFQEVNGYRVVRELGRGDTTKPPAAIASNWGLNVGDVISGVEIYRRGNDESKGNIVFLTVRHIGLKCVLCEERMYNISVNRVEPKSCKIDAETAAYSLAGRPWRLMERIPEPKAEQAEPAKDRVIHARGMSVLKVTLRENGDVELEDSNGTTHLHARDGSCKTTSRYVDGDSLTTVTTCLWSPSGELLSTQKLAIAAISGNTVETWLDRDDKMVKEVVTVGDSVTTTTVERSSSRRTDEQPG